MADLQAKAKARAQQLVSLGFNKTNIYGLDEAGGLNVFYLLLDRPAVYGQPEKPVVPQRRLQLNSVVTVVGAALMGLAALVSFRERGAKGAQA